jgi:YVTN family beta-propeller protein
VAYRFSPDSKTWAVASTKDRPRGLAGSLSGKVYVANDTSDNVAVVDAGSPTTLAYVYLGGGRFPIGIAVDPGGFVWAVNQSFGSAIKIDPESNKTVCEVKVGSGPYTYSDMTGYVLHNFTAPDLNPFFIHQFSTAGEAGATWLSVKIQATSSGACQPMSVLVRKVVDGAPLPWTPVAENVPISTAEFPLAGLPAGTKAIEVKLVLPYQSGGCKFAVEGVSATWTVP